MSLAESIRKYALQNAVKFNGKANPGAVIGKILGEDPSLKAKMKDVSKQVNMTINEVNKLGADKAKEELLQLAPELLEEKKHVKKEGLKELPNVKDNVVMRFAPSPSGPMHIGHAYGISLSSEYCRKYKGKLIFRIEDTNPDNIYPPAYELLPKDAEWITKDNVKEILVQSDRLELYYKYAEELFDKDALYVCTCNPEEAKKLRDNKEACPCRGLDRDEQKARWKKMFDDYNPGDAVVRVKTDIKHKNPAMRDFPVFRINESDHPRQGKKFRVWPLMNMSVAIDDIESGMTHIIRAKEHHDNALRQKYIYEYLGKEFPETLFVGRINFEGMPVSCSKTKKAIAEGKYSDWDDIRLPFLLALRRRGYQPDAFIKYSVDVGVSLADKKVTKEEFFKIVNAFNKDIIDPVSNRYFFIWDPRKVKIEGAPSQEIELDLHPDNKKGGRKFKVCDEFYLCNEDYDKIKDNESVRLMDCLSLVKKKDLVFDSLEYDKDKTRKIIHWLPTKDNVKVEVVMPDKKIIKGVGETGLGKLKEGDIVQLQRFGFCRLDKKDKDKLIFWYCHK